MPDPSRIPSQPQLDSHKVDWALLLFTRLQRFAWDVSGVVTLALALMTLLAIIAPSLTSGYLRWWAHLLSIWFGWGSLWILGLISLAGLLMLRRRVSGWHEMPWRNVFALEAAAFTTLAWLAVLGGTSLERADAGLDGGRIGWALAYFIGKPLLTYGFFGELLRILLLSLLLLFTLLAGFGVTSRLVAWIKMQAGLTESFSDLPVEPPPAVSTMQSPSSAPKRKTSPLPAAFRKRLHLPTHGEAVEKPTAPPPRDERLPPLDLLVNEVANHPDERSINMTAGVIEKTLSEFGIPARVVGFRVGPTVTQFAVEPGYIDKTGNGEADANRQKVRVAQISTLSRDLALALSAERLRIEAPVPGRPYVGIEVPNARSSVVRLRPILEAEAFYRVGSPLAITFGRDVSGQPVIADLAKMPHMLVAGTTGSGKSVCIAAITTCLVMNNTPADLRLVMIDPKMVELVRFNGLPHLLGKVETDLERILGVLRWTVAEMDRRYRLLEASHSRNLESYNHKIHRRKGEQRAGGVPGQPLPQIVVLIDELADLMMSAPEQTEPAIVRLAQMARATGIHLVVATQRPSTDVVTGLIKANFPARISFAVASSIDSRVILDTTGAESLLGRGDMLFLPPEASSPLRAQGVIVTDQEVERVITFWQQSSAAGGAEPAPWEDQLKQDAILADHDGLIEQAIKMVRGTGRASASMLQRRLHIGYPRAARLVDELEEMGMVGPPISGGREREVLIERDDELDIDPADK